MASTFSIIIPHRDCPDLLQRCLDSIPIREGFQIIVVDDNSNSSVVDFDRFPGSNRDDVKIVFTTEGKGAGFARNVGLEFATGEWVIFADADDYFSPQELVRLSELDIPKEVGVVLYQFKYYHKDGSFHIYPEKVGFDLSVCYDTNILCRDAVMPWAKMVRREYLDKYHIRFDEIKWGNDMIYSTKLSLSVDSFLIAPFLVYFHEWIANSLVNKEPGLKMYYKRALLSLKRARLLQSRGRLNYNIFTDQWYKRIYSLNYLYAIILRIKSMLELGPKYCLKNWRLFTHKSLYLTRLFVKRLINKF